MADMRSLGGLRCLVEAVLWGGFAVLSFAVLASTASRPQPAAAGRPSVHEAEQRVPLEPRPF